MVQDKANKLKTNIEFLCALNGVEVWVKRDDLIDPFVSGNKLYKLKYNLEQALKEGKNSLLTFGGAFSNHIAATASYAQQHGLKSIGIIRGEYVDRENPTLAFAASKGMQLNFVSRDEYKQKHHQHYLHTLRKTFPDAFIIPEGGANALGIKGAEEILTDQTQDFDAVVCAIGTGTTVAGILKACADHQRVIGVTVHKHAKIMDEVLDLDPRLSAHWHKLSVETDFHCGGYAKWNMALIEFMQTIHRDYGLKTDPIYTGKALFALNTLIQNNTFSAGNRVLFIHTGGLQGVAGFEKRFNINIFDNA